MVYNSRLLACKMPYGAVTSGTQVLFCFRPPREWSVWRVFLCAHDEFNDRYIEVPLQWEGLEGSADRYAGSLDTENMAGPIWYYFRYERTDGSLGFFGNNESGRGGEGQRYDHDPKAYQITVTYEMPEIPEWYGKGLTYQIFPDRFRRAGKKGVNGLVGDRILHKHWDECPDFLPDKNGEIRNRDFFGGDLAGVIEKLPYLYELGVKTIYFNPIFEAASNHRYDTADYSKIDPLFGTEEEFSMLCKKAGELGIRVMLDGVFNHTGFDSLYFNGKGTYDTIGAYQSKESPYFSWFDFINWPDEYSSWWGIYTLPQVNESNPDYLEYMYTGENSIIRRWLRAGASAWRLDVADEIPGECLELLRKSVKEEKSDAVIIGEVWEDASNKTAYGVRRKYLLGRELDGVMNYPFRDKLIGFLLGESSKDFIETMENLKENYPRPCFYSLMNSLGTHDTPRILTVLGSSHADWTLDKKSKSKKTLSGSSKALARDRLKLGVVVMFSFPGSPTVFYGDEAGMEGFEDPFNRRPYPWGNEDKELLKFYRKLSKIRNSSKPLQEGELYFIESPPEILAFERELRSEKIIIAVNRGSTPFALMRPWVKGKPKDLLSGKLYDIEDGTLYANIEPMQAVIIACR